MVHGLDRFQSYFRGFENQYVIIGGTACDLLMFDEGIDFRATKDIDLVLIMETITPEFGKRLWRFILEGGYEHRKRGTDLPQFYRFSHPTNPAFPHMIELFARRDKDVRLPSEATLEPLHIDEDISSLSAILLDDAYYGMLREGATEAEGVSVLAAPQLILFKIKAFLDLTQRRAAGESVDSRHIRKHRNDVFRLSTILRRDMRIPVTREIHGDLETFIDIMKDDPFETSQIGLDRNKHQILDRFEKAYYVDGADWT